MSLVKKTTAPRSLWIISLLAFFIPLIFMVGKVLDHTNGAFAYPLDDTYIHLAVARNLVEHHIWGVSGHEFASASSSVLYPLVLAGIFLVTGVQTIVPFIINLLAALVFLYVLQRWLAKKQLSFNAQLAVILITIFLIPLPAVVMVGMEHTFHLLFFFLFVTSFGEAISDKKPLTWHIYLWGALMMATRFESMSVVGVACLILALYRQWVTAVKLGVICFLPVIIFGVFSVSHGGFFLPNAVVLKPSLPPLNADDISVWFSQQLLPRLFGNEDSHNTLGVQRLLIVIPLTYVLFRKYFGERVEYTLLLTLLMGMALFHIVFAAFSFYARYEAYLVGTSVAICAAIFARYSPIRFNESLTVPELAGALLGLFVLVPLASRSYDVFSKVSLGSIWTYDQQCQMGNFIHEYYDKDGVTFNDIGAVSYYSEGKKLDILGLGNNDVARIRLAEQNGPRVQDSLARLKDIRIGIIYEPRFKPFTKNWTKVASWDIPYPDPIGFYDSVTWYALKPEDAPRLMNNLKSYQGKLPQEVKVRYY